MFGFWTVVLTKYAHFSLENYDELGLYEGLKSVRNHLHEETF